jgi:hypothetical protein
VTDTGLEFVLSTHEEGRPKGMTIMTTLIFYVLIGVVLLISGGYTYYHFYTEKLNIDLEFFKFMPFMLIIFGFIVLILGIRNIQKHETIIVDRKGITINHGNKYKTASWNEIKKIKSSMTFVPTYKYVFLVQFIFIETQNWKHKIKKGNFSANDLKQLFLNIAEQAKNTSVNIVDGLEWLPEQIEFQKSKEAGISARIREYKILFKLGLMMLILGFLIFIPIFVLNLFESNLFIIFILLLFFGLMLTIVGGCGINEEKKKIQDM